MTTLLLAAWLAAPASAADSPPFCVHKASGTYQEPETLQALLDCHKEKLAAASEAYKRKGGKQPPDAVVEVWEDRQREEVRDYLSRHPEKATLEGESSSDSVLLDKAGPAEKESQAGELKELAGEDRKAVTPELALRVAARLKKMRKGVSPELMDLLKSIHKDGPELSEETLLKLRDAARDAKADGLDLKLAPGDEKAVLGGD